jgi:glycine/serine hydroxymethyltransferase
MAEHTCKQEVRLTNLENKNHETNIDVNKLLVRFDSLIGVLKVVGVLLGGSTITAMGFLITYWVKG